jgi:trans-aconitate methyltransferase
MGPRDFDTTVGAGAQPYSANVVDLAQVRADRAHQSELEYIFGVAYPRNIRQRATRLREFAEEIERHALTGDHCTLDWLDVMALRPIERAIEERERLAVLGRQYGLTR